jgi:hypothetical protein
MSERPFKVAGAANRGDGDSGLGARGIAPRAAADDAARAAKARRNAWLLGGLAVFFYVGYIAWMFIRAQGG